MAKPKISKVEQWLQEEKDILPPSEAAKKLYDEKLVAFIDILGMRNQIRDANNEAEEILTIMGQLLTYVQNACNELEAKDKLNYLPIGDGIIINADLECIGSVCEILATIQWQVLIYTKNLLRGALTVGKVTMSDDPKLIIGPAFIEAFEMESENAIFPRILISQKLEKSEHFKNIDFKYVSEDNDKFFYIDFIKYIGTVENIDDSKLGKLLKKEGIIDYLVKKYNDNLVDKQHIAQKYGWVLNKLETHKIQTI